MPPKSNHSINEPLPPSPVSPSSLPPEAITSKSVRPNPVWLGTPPPGGLGRCDTGRRSLANPIPYLNTSVADSATLKPSTHLTYPPSPPETPERSSTRLRSEVQALYSDLPTLPESSERPPPRPLVEDCRILKADTSSEFSIIEATTTESVGSQQTSPRLSSTDVNQSKPEELDLSALDSQTTWHFFSLGRDILATLHRRRARAREARIRNVIRLIKQLRDEEYPGTELVIRRRLYHSEYRDLLALVEVDRELEAYFYDELRFEYLYAEQQFTVRMTTKLHDTFAIKFNDTVRRFLDEHSSSADNSVVSKIAGSIEGTGSGSICPPELEFNKKAGDMSFQLQGSSYPGLVMEVAWSDKMSRVKEKARYYFDSTHGEVRTVVGFNLYDIYKKQEAVGTKWAREKEKRKRENLPPSSEPLAFLDPAAAATCASFSVWRAKHDLRSGKTTVARTSVQNQIFRLTDQQHNPNVSLELSLEDFVSKAAVDKLCAESGAGSQKVVYPSLRISSELLCDWFKRSAEIYRPDWERQQKRKERLREKKEDAKMAAQRKEAAALEREARKSNNIDLLGPFRNLRRVLRSGRYKKPDEGE